MRKNYWVCGNGLPAPREQGLKRHGNNGSNGFIAHCFSPLGEAVCSASTQCRLARANFRRGINGIIWRKGSDIRDFA